jgi:hypothetical protein
MIEGVLSAYSIGDYVTANCTSGKSNPAAALAWRINGVEVSFIGLSAVCIQGLEGLGFEIQPRHVTRINNRQRERNEETEKRKERRVEMQQKMRMTYDRDTLYGTVTFVRNCLPDCCPAVHPVSSQATAVRTAVSFHMNFSLNSRSAFKIKSSYAER